MNKGFRAWTPVRLTQGEGTFSIDVWGRTYTFDHSLLPVSIVTAGREILARPMEMQLDFSGELGKIEDVSYLVRSVTDEEAVIVASGVCRNVSIDMRYTFSFDGFCKTDVTLVPFWGPFWLNEDEVQNEPKLTGFAMETVLTAESSNLFHYWPNDTQSILPSQTVVNSGKTVSADYPFKPFIYCGWAAGGLGFCCETEEGFQLDDPEKCISVTCGEKETSLRIRVLDSMPGDWVGHKDTWCDTLMPKTFTFGFQATPVRAPETEYKYDRYVWTSGTPEARERALEMAVKYGAHWMILHEKWSAIQNYGQPEDEEAVKDFVRRCHDRGVKVMGYFGYEMSTLCELYPDKRNEYLLRTPEGKYTGGWQRKPWQRDFMVCYHGGYSKVLIDRVLRSMDEYGMDGVYTDSTFVPWECANEAHGCGYRDKEGKLHSTFPIFAVRETVKELYREVHLRGGVIDTHQSSCCMTPTISFCDSYFDGENIQNSIKKDPKFLDQNGFLCEFAGRNLGIPAVMLCYIGMEMLSGVCLVHNVVPRMAQDREEDLRWVSRIWDIYDRYELRRVPWRPYYEPGCPVLPEDPRVLASAWEARGCLVAAVCTLDTDVSGDTLRAEGYRKAEDLLTGAEYILEEGKLPVSLVPREVLLLKLTK